MGKHTPGPWWYTAKLTASENHKGFVIGGGSGWRLGDLIPVDQDGEEGEANARLIAAAPELLDTLKKARDELMGLPHSLGYEFTHIPEIDAAIAKAEGKE